MKTLKLHALSLILFSLALMTGCYENPASVKTDFNSMIQKDNAGSDTALISHTYSAKLIINPGETVYFNYSNTLLILISGYSVSNCSTSSRDLLISSINYHGGNNMPCDWECGPELLLDNLCIKNLSTLPKKIFIKMNGFTLNH